MSYFSQFPQKSFESVKKILIGSGHESILEHIIKRGDSYELRKPINNISPLPTYKFAIACSLASLGNTELASEISPGAENIIEPEFGDNISKDLAVSFLS
jgi:hypothetical protein